MSLIRKEGAVINTDSKEYQDIILERKRRKEIAELKQLVFELTKRVTALEGKNSV